MTTTSTMRRPERGHAPFVASGELGASLQRVLADLVELHLQAKQAHWNVVGPNFRDLHLQLDEIVDAARVAADTIAERMRALGAVPDGRSDTVAATTSLAAFPGGLHPSHEVVGLITSRLHAVAATLRDVHDAVDAEDPSSSDLLHEITSTVEKYAWLVGAESSTPQSRS